MTADDSPTFARFAAQVPDGDRRFVKENLEDIADSTARRLVAVERDGDIIGTAGAFPGTGWSAHVAEVRVLVSAEHRRRGVGRALARAALADALNLGCSHVYVEVIAEQEGLVAMFQDMEFEPAALLPDFVRDGVGDFHDLMLLTHRADQSGLNQVLGLHEVGA